MRGRRFAIGVALMGLALTAACSSSGSQPRATSTASVGTVSPTPTASPTATGPASRPLAIKVQPACFRRHCRVTLNEPLRDDLRLVSVSDPGVYTRHKVKYWASAIAAVLRHGKVLDTLRMTVRGVLACCHLTRPDYLRRGSLIDPSGLIALNYPGNTAQGLLALGWDGRSLFLIDGSERLNGAIGTTWADLDGDGYYEASIAERWPYPQVKRNWTRVYQRYGDELVLTGCYEPGWDQPGDTSYRRVACSSLPDGGY